MSTLSVRRLSNITRNLRVLSYGHNCNGYNINKRWNCHHNADKNIVHSSLKDIKFPGMTIPEYVFQDFGKYPNKIALECGLTGKKYTYEELRRKSKNFGKTLRKKFKLNRGDVIALVLPNVPDIGICVLGALDAGLVVTTVNPVYTPDEVRRQLVDSGSKLVITLGQLWPLAQAAVSKLPNTVPIITIKMLQSETLPNNTINFQECIDTEYDVEDIRDSDFEALAILPYSSGTTGLPKGVELSSKNIISNMEQLRDPYLLLGSYTTDDHQDVVPAILPMFHIYGITALLLNNLLKLCKLVCLPKFTPDIYIDMLIKHKPHVLYIVPPIVVLMNNSPLVKREYLQSINLICSGAAPLGALDEEKLQKKANKEIDIVQGYGLTESSCCTTLMSPIKKKEFNITGSVGSPVGGTSIKIVPVDNPYGEALGPHECGELLIRGPQMTKGYHNKPEETKNAFIDGWFRTGDMGYYDNHHSFYITDRLKELIKVKAFQVAPAELEEIIRDYPGVLDTAVIGVPHERYGEVPRAYVVPKKDSIINAKKLEEYVAGKVAEFKQLKGGVSLIESIPKTASGKTLRKDLKLIYEKEMQR